MKPLPPDNSAVPPEVFHAVVAGDKGAKRRGGASKQGGKAQSQRKAAPKKAKERRSAPRPRAAGRATRERRQLSGQGLFTRKNGLFALATIGVGLWLVYFYPFSTAFTRRATLGMSAAGGVLLLATCWRVRGVRWAVLALFLAGAVFVALPGRTNYDRLALRAEFASVLRRYEGVRYCKGGEGAYGVDGQGLVRRASIEAPLCHGLRTLNPWLVRHAFKAWWQRELPLGKWPLSRRISKVKSVHGFNDLILYAGDYALLDGERGAMVYLGHHQWIVADEDRGIVSIVDGRTASASPSLQQSGALFRWRLLEARR